LKSTLLGRPRWLFFGGIIGSKTCHSDSGSSQERCESFVLGFIDLNTPQSTDSQIRVFNFSTGFEGLGSNPTLKNCATIIRQALTGQGLGEARERGSEGYCKLKNAKCEMKICSFCTGQQHVQPNPPALRRSVEAIRLLSSAFVPKRAGGVNDVHDSPLLAGEGWGRGLIRFQDVLDQHENLQFAIFILQCSCLASPLPRSP